MGAMGGVGAVTPGWNQYLYSAMGFSGQLFCHLSTRSGLARKGLPIAMMSTTPELMAPCVGGKRL